MKEAATKRSISFILTSGIAEATSTNGGLTAASFFSDEGFGDQMKRSSGSQGPTIQDSFVQHHGAQESSSNFSGGFGEGGSGVHWVAVDQEELGLVLMEDLVAISVAVEVRT